ncbi:DUF6942 family protein [Microbulbifer aggregans]|uniref:DUF6942 family protein n=1 Tax=Microbulbifer aggregans TaxID=1769779 RepID=UPI001CFD4937|nr:hypothetical protein [Microbulbifer aggregans]
MSNTDYLGSPCPSLVLYLPHRPNGLEELLQIPDAGMLMDNNSNHWRKIVTLLAKVASPTAEWRGFRDRELFQRTALCFAPRLMDISAWHWIGGKDNLERFNIDGLNPVPLQGTPTVAIDSKRQILLTPYPDYRQLSNATVSQIRAALDLQGFYTAR